MESIEVAAFFLKLFLGVCPNLDLGVFVAVDQFPWESFWGTLTLLTQPLLRAPPSFHPPSEKVTEADSDPWEVDGI